jgi:GAF domain-containing protein
MGTLQLYDTASETLRLVAHQGFKAPFLDHFAVVRDEPSTCREAMRHRERVIVEDVAQSPIFRGTPEMAVLEEASVGAIQSTPLVARDGKLLGMFSTHWKEPHRLDADSLQLLDLLARQAAVLIGHRQREQ